MAFFINFMMLASYLAEAIVINAKAAAERIRETAAQKAEETVARREAQAAAKIEASEAAMVSELRAKAASLAVGAARAALMVCGVAPDTSADARGCASAT